MKNLVKQNLIIIPGLSTHNKKWLSDIENAYSKTYETTAITYDHWESNSDIDLNNEVNKLDKIIAEKEKFTIIAKSIGCVITLLSKKSSKAEKIIFCGFPINLCKKNKIDATIEDALAKKITILQKKSDPAGSWQQIKKEFKNTVVKEINGDDHNYPIDIIKKEIA